MHASRLVPSATHCRSSPDGLLIASLDASSITLRSTKTLQITNVVKLPKEFTGPVSSFHWAPTSAKILVAAADHIHVFSATDVPFHAAIQTAAFGTGKLSSVRFGPKDTDIIACSSLGLKIAVFDLITSTAIEIANPKFYLSSSVSRTYAVRPQSHHLAILTRVNGKDVVSVHNPSNRQVQKSWTADTVDAQAVLWTPDGHWLVLWDSPAQGHRIALYTADGQHFSTMTSANLNVQKDAELAPGITTCQPSPDSRWLAVGDHSRGITMLSTLFWRPRMTLQHPNTVTPRDTLQVWQEQLASTADGQPPCSFLRATQSVAPPALVSEGKASADLKQGCSVAIFDSSSSLLATMLEDAPCTVWIWDVTSEELRAVVIFHSNISVAWHPTLRETLLITCQDEARPGVFYMWDPLSQGPSPILADDYLPRKGVPESKARVQMSWLNIDNESPVLLASNSQNFRLLSTSEDGLDGWRYDSQNQHQEDSWHGEEMSTLAGDDGALPENTFSFKSG